MTEAILPIHGLRRGRKRFRFYSNFNECVVDDLDYINVLLHSSITEEHIWDR